MIKFSIDRALNVIPPRNKCRFLDVSDPELTVLHEAGIVCCIYVLWQGDWRIERNGKQQMPHIDFYWIYDQTMTVESQFGVLKAGPGELLVVPSWFDRRQTIIGAECPHLYIRVDAPERFPQCRTIHVLPSSHGQELAEDVLRLIAATSTRSRTPRYRECLAELIAIQFHEEVTHSTEDFRTNFLDRLSGCLHRDGNQRITVPELAQVMGMSESSLYKKCMQSCGMSPQRMLTEHRFRQARHYLLYTSYSLSEIAEFAGYSDLFAFSKAFRNFFGTAPSFYRKTKR